MSIPFCITDSYHSGLMAQTIRFLDVSTIQMAHRAPNNHIGRRHVQRNSGQSGPVTRFVPGTPEYERLIAERQRTD